MLKLASTFLNAIVIIMSNKIIKVIRNALIRIWGIDHDDRRQDQPILITTFEPMHHLQHVSVSNTDFNIVIGSQDMISIPLVLFCY